MRPRRSSASGLGERLLSPIHSRRFAWLRTTSIATPGFRESAAADQRVLAKAKYIFRLPVSGEDPQSGPAAWAARQGMMDEHASRVGAASLGGETGRPARLVSTIRGHGSWRSEDRQSRKNFLDLVAGTATETEVAESRRRYPIFTVRQNLETLDALGG